MLYPRMAALDAIGRYEVFYFTTDFEIRFVSDKTEPTLAHNEVLGTTYLYDETPIVLAPDSSADITTATPSSDLTY